jgi:starch synthase
MDFPQPLRVLFVVSEADPFIKVGGLGDVGGSLPRAIHRIEHPPKLPAGEDDSETLASVDIRVVLPFHGAIAAASSDLRPVAAFNVPYRDGPQPAVAYDRDMEGVPVYLISGDPIPPAGPVYSGDPEIDGNKYTFFSMAALELARSLGWQPHLLHANDWHTAASVYAISIRPEDAFFASTATLLGIHNLPYLGTGTGPSLSAYGLPPATGTNLPEWAQHLPLPLGLSAADQIVAVSPTYAKEILTPEFGSGLYDFLQERAGSISGILNGLDLEQWDPSTDRRLAANFDSASLPRRTLNKRALQEELGLEPDPQIPLLAMVTRMDNQKGVDLALDALQQIEIPEEHPVQSWQAVILGTGTPFLEEAATRMQANYPDRIRAILAFDADLSRRIYGGADALLIPSRYEPCGLAQMIAMRYGCVPIARAVGGLMDTIRPYPDKKANGFLFTDPTPEALSGTIRKALATYADQKTWRKLQKEGMIQDFSWERSAREYISLYRSMVASRSQWSPRSTMP